MNKTELIAAVAEKTDLSKKDADAAVSAVLGAITDALKAGDKIQLVGFGTFEVRNRAAKQSQSENRRDHDRSRFQGSGFQSRQSS